MSKFSKTISICKVDSERRVVKGPVLRPEIRDRQGTIMSADIIIDAAHDFVARLADKQDPTQPGFMHTEFNRDLVIVESYVTERDEKYALSEEEKTLVPSGSWMMAIKVNDDKIWEGVKSGTFKGFSIGGRARLQYDEEGEEN